MKSGFQGKKDKNSEAFIREEAPDEKEHRIRTDNIIICSCRM